MPPAWLSIAGIGRGGLPRSPHPHPGDAATAQSTLLILTAEKNGKTKPGIVSDQT
jgi:hypothetical protein